MARPTAAQARAQLDASTDQDYGCNYSEWAIACPDGAVWADEFYSRAQGQDALRTADKDCGCEHSPHVLLTRDVPEWEKDGAA